MTSMDKGRVCVKTAGRDKGVKCVIMGVLDENNVEALCADRKKRRKCNKRHLRPTEQVVDAGSDEEALKAIA